jgi:peroxiredoxin/uncharacterized membrane protein YphA (DoxX/SURF4 family)
MTVDVLLTARLFLAAVFAVAGVAKLVDRAGARRSARAFGVPDALAPAFAVLLPAAELICAAALVPARSASWGAAGALILLVLFIAAIVVNMALGRRPDCHCFGQLHSSPAGWKTLSRNVALAAIAWYVGSGFSRTYPSLTLDTTALLVLVVAAQAVIGAVLFYQVLRQNGRMLLRLDAIEAQLGLGERKNEPALAGLEAGSVAPDFRLARLDGGTATLASLWEDGRSVILFFTEPNCQGCDELLPQVGKWQHEHTDRVTVVPVSRGDVQANRTKARAHNIQGMLLQKDREVADAFRADRTPSALLVTAGQISSPLALGPDAIRALLKQATMPPPLKQGDRVPSMRLRDLSGGTTDLAVLGDRSTLLLFWNPACGFCQAMLDDVKAWERDRSNDARELVVISAGSPKANREQGFRSRVLLDSAFNAGSRFGAEGTPSAVLVDEHGRVASEVGVGAKAVFALAGTLSADALSSA